MDGGRTGIPIDKAEILAIFLETFFYGIYFSLFCITLHILFTNRNDCQRVNRPLLITSFIMMFLATGHIIIDFVRIIEAFITKRQSTEGGAIGYYSDISNPLHILKTGFYVTQTLTGDGVAVWRCFVVHGRTWLVVIFPILLLVGSAITGYVGLWILASASPGGNVFDTGHAWITSFFVITLAVNLYCTGMMVYPIWASNRNTGKCRQYSTAPVVFVTVESCALYSSALLALLITYLSGSNGQYPALDIVTPLVGIVFCLIIIQLNAYMMKRNNNTPPFATNSPSRWRVGQSPNTCPLQTVSVEITQTIRTDYDGEDILEAANDTSGKSPDAAMNASRESSEKFPEDLWFAV